MADDEDDKGSDELAAKRLERTVTTPLAATGKRFNEPEVKPEKRAPLWRWFSSQIAHSMPARAAAAQHVKDRWNLAYVQFSKIDRALSREDSEHLVAFRELLDEYRSLFQVPEDDDSFARETGVGGKMLPFTIEKCESCRREAIPGTGKCAKHGGQWISEKDLSDMSRRLREKLVVSAESAIRTLQDLMDNAKSEQVRSQAAAMILDRAGLGATLSVNHTGTVSIVTADEAMEQLRGRLDTLAVNLERRAEIESATVSPSTGVDDIVDAEVVEPEPVKVKRA